MAQFINPFSLDTVRLPSERIVDRETQIDYLNDRVIGNSENVLVVGPFGIGKTCLLRKFRSTLQQNFADQTLIIEMEMRRVSADPSDFLSDVLLKLLGVFWEQVLKRPFSELIRSVTSQSDVRERIMPQVKAVLELYRLLRPTSVTAEIEEHNAIGLEKFVRATKEERISRNVVRGDLQPPEFVSLDNEILAALSKEGIKRTIIFGDEANHIDPDVETDIIRRNFEVFASRNVQFVLTANMDIVQRVPHLRDAFPAWIEVRPFEDRRVFEELITVYSATGDVPKFTPSSRQFIWEISRGNPREIQRLCQESVTLAIARARAGGSELVDLEILMETIPRLYELKPK
jgi:DNA polymerase III delta prime subunit